MRLLGRREAHPLGDNSPTGRLHDIGSASDWSVQRLQSGLMRWWDALFTLEWPCGRAGRVEWEKSLAAPVAACW